MSKRIATRRLVHQDLAHATRSPPDVVRWMGAVQGQEPASSRWALGLRSGASEAEIEGALDRGEIIRTHGFRWTWQLIAPEDVRWMLALVGPKLIRSSARRDAELGLDGDAYRRGLRAIERALRDGASRTRAELAAAITAEGVSTGAGRLSHLLGRAELEGLIGSGPRRGKQTTHVRLDAPPCTLSREEQLATLARRYFQSRGPATVDDFTWWTGLNVADARAAHASIAGELVRDDDLWDRDEPASAPSRVHLLPAFDEYLVGYRVRDHVLDPAHVKLINAGGGLLAPCVVDGGRIVASWRRVLGRGSVAITIAPFGPLRSTRAITAAAVRYAAFLGLEPEVRFTAPPRSTSRSRPRPAPSSAGSANGPKRAPRS